MADVKLRENRPRYQAVIDHINQDIKSGKYLPGDKLPSLMNLSKSLGLHHLTVRRGLRVLADKGLLEVRPKAGSFITDNARGLTKKKTGIGLVCGSFLMEVDKQHPSVGAFIIGANRRCHPPDFIVQTVFCDTPFSEDVVQFISSDSMAGLILFEVRLKDDDVALFRRHCIPVVHINPPAQEEDGWIITLTQDLPNALTQAVEHLRSLGHQRIGCISYSREEGSLRRRFAQLAFDHRLGTPDELLVLVDNPSHDAHWEDVEKFFAIKPLPTGVIVHDEFQADILLDGCERRGIKVPQDLSVVTLQDSKPYGHRLPLTTVFTGEDISRMATTACDLLMRRIAGLPVENHHVKVVAELTAKASTGPERQ